MLHAEVGGGTMPTLRTTSPTAPGMERSWTTIEAFMHEVANARIYDGVHYRTSTEVGTAMGQKIQRAGKRLKKVLGHARKSLI